MEIWGNASDIHLQPLITTHKKMVIIITFSSYCPHTNILFNHLNVLPFKKLLFLRIGLKMFKYKYGQLPEALNMFFLLRIDLCIITILETRTNSALLYMYAETSTFDLLVSMFGIIYVTYTYCYIIRFIQKDTKKIILSEKIMFYLI